MGTLLERVSALPDFGITPVPRDKRVLSGFDLGVLWGDLGIGLLVLVTGALLVPALGFWTALVAIVLGSVIGVGLLALGAVAGADHGVPTMVLLRPVLGIRGSWLPSLVNVAQLVGWTAVELWAMSFVADLVSERVFGFSARWVWLAIAAVTCTWLALWGPLGVTRVWMERFGAWMTVGICLAITALLVTQEGITQALGAPGTGGWPTFGPAMDLVIAMPISWLPLVADYSRFARGSAPAFLGTFGGYLLANVWLYTLGALLVLGAGADPSPAGIATGILAIAGGTVAGVLFLAGLLVGESDQAFADVYSGAVALKNVWPRVSQPPLALAIVATSTALAAWLTMERYEAFLFLVGSVFVPLFGMLAADHFVIRRRRLDLDDLYEPARRYWFTAGVRLKALLPWAGGILVYHWIAPTGPAWWVDLVSGFTTPLSVRWPWLAASLPSFFVAFALSLFLRPRPSRLSSSRALPKE